MGNNICITIHWQVFQPFIAASKVLPSNLVLEPVAKADMYCISLTRNEQFITILSRCGLFMGLHRNNVDSLHGKLLFSQNGNVTVNDRKIKGLFQGKRHAELVFQLDRSSQQEERFSRRRLAIDGPHCWALGGNLWSREALTSIEFDKLKTMPLLCPKMK